MKWNLATMAVLSSALALVGAWQPAGAQRWNDTRSRALVERATTLRAVQLADTALRDYRAEARGFVTFLAQLGEGFTEPPKIVKADELALDVYWLAPDRSKQFIRGRRDTLLLPTDINYHRDHLGIIQNNFPETIRLGDGDEVRDVPHPLSAAGLREYDFAIGDSLEIRLGPRTLQVYEVRVRPKDDRQPRAIGALYIDRQTAELARMTLSFTRAALKDRDLEDVTVVLENGLIDGRFWLPRRQEIEIRRTGTWLDYPARGIIRGRWEICCYAVNVGLNPRMFEGPEIVTAIRPSTLPDDPDAPPLFTGEILDNLPEDVRAVTDAEIRAVQEEARALVRAQALARTRSTSLAGRRISDFARFDRVEGLALGAGVTQRVGGGVSLFAGGRYGFSDHAWKGRVGLTYRRASGAGAELAAYDDHRLAGDEMERSLLVNSFAAQEFGSDYTDPFGVRGYSLLLFTPAVGGWRGTIGYAAENHRPLAVNAAPANGDFAPTLAAGRIDERRLTLILDRSTHLTVGGIEAQYRFEGALLRFGSRGGGAFSRWGVRGSMLVNLERPVGAHRLVARLAAAALGNEHVVSQTDAPDPIDPPDVIIPGLANVQPQHLVYFGGPVTGPGYGFHELMGTAGVSTRVEWRAPVPFPAISLGRFGRAPARLTLAPYANLVWINGSRDVSRDNGLYPSVGVGALTIFDLLRVDIARGLRNGRWTLSVDLSRDFWPVL